MDSFSYLHAVTPASQDQKRPNRERMSKKKWREQALRRLHILARRVGLTEDKLLALAGVSSIDELTLNAIGSLTDELHAWGRGTWE